VSRRDVLDTLARHIAAQHRPHPLRVAIDGADAAGKTTLADELAEPVRALGRPVIRSSVDDFHNPRAHRYRLGAESPEGYFEDSFDLATIRTRLLGPLGPGGSRHIQCQAFDYRSDCPVDPDTQDAPEDAVLLFDGVFLQRPELRDLFDLAIFVDAPFEETTRRSVDRDGCHPDVEHPSNRRYVGGQRLYLARCEPRDRADVVLDNSDWREPRIVRLGAAS
jgi:uridine kinase